MRRTILFAFAALLLPAMAAAEEPRFFIESIRIAGTHYSSADIVRAESKLVAGRSYTEAQLRDAVARVHRLPFVIDADVRLEKGSERGRFVLVLRIEETKPLFANYQSSFQTIDSRRDVITYDPLTGEQQHHYDTRRFRTHNDYPTIGGRMFLGSRGMLAGYADLAGTEQFFTGDNRYSLAYTQYDLFGTRASVAGIVQYHEFMFDFSDFPQLGGKRTTSFGDHLVWDVTGAIPIFENQAIRASWHREQARMLINPTGVDTFVRAPIDAEKLAWVYDTTNDLLFPTSGTHAEADLSYRRFPRLADTAVRGNVKLAYDSMHDVAVELTHYHEISDRQSISGFIQSNNGFGRITTVGSKYNLIFWNGRFFGYSDMRLVTQGELVRYAGGGTSGMIGGGLAFRNPWGVARIDFRYLGWRRGP